MVVVVVIVVVVAVAVVVTVVVVVVVAVSVLTSREAFFTKRSSVTLKALQSASEGSWLKDS